MLFHSPAFLLLFLPVALAAFAAAERRGRSAAIAIAAFFSLLFYAWWSVEALALLLASALFNFGAGRWIARDRARARAILAAAVAANLVLLAYFKVAASFLGAAGPVVQGTVALADVALPLGISFFTFTQIGFLVDTARGTAREYRLVDYVLFVSWFPHLIAGPILHHAEMMPQFRDPSAGIRERWLAAGLMIFAIGLFKKVVLADSLGVHVGPVFDAPPHSATLGALDAWGGALAYAMQLYFDFSGYSDMAIGLSLAFGIRLPLNFDSPYKAVSPIDFWRRWHMTLSRFLREYLYVPLGGNRLGARRQYLNIMATMVVGGLWHGVGWTFAAWGAWHGLLVCANHAWRRMSRFEIPRTLSIALTFLAVLVGWVFFRAHSMADAAAILQAMAGAGGMEARIVRPSIVPALLVASMVVWGLPNTAQLLAAEEPALSEPQGVAPRWRWKPSPAWVVVCSLMLLAVLARVNAQSSFLYFRF